MTPRHQTSPTMILLLAGLIVFLAVRIIPPTHAQGQVQVTAADPFVAEQGTINLNVKVTGKGFKNGAKAKWFVTGTADTGGVTVNATTFVSSTEVTANITIADTAVIADFDIQVLNSDGRGGKGTELFKVTSKNATNCPAIQPPPIGDTKCYAALPGCLDATFGGIGFVHIDPNPGTYHNDVSGVAVQPDGKIVVSGSASSAATNKDFAVIRYNSDGSLDTSFGDVDPFNPSLRRGSVVTAVTINSDTSYALTLQPDGKILVSGWAGSESVAVRYNIDGTLDPGFGSAGIAHLGGSAPARDVKLQADGKIIVGGAAGGGFGLLRLNSDGSSDTTFGSNGVVFANPSGAKRGSGHGWNFAIQRVPAITGEERIVMTGWSAVAQNAATEWTLMRFRSNGSVDTTFGTSGIVKTAFFGFGDQARIVRIDSNNRIVAAGFVRSASGACGAYVEDSAVVRYNQDGALDGTFSGGRKIFDVYGGNDNIAGLILQPDGKIVTFGYARSSDGSVNDFALIRLNADGSRDSSFGLLGNGVVTTDLNGTESWGFALALQPSDGKIVAAGSVYMVPPFSNGDIFVSRYLP